MIAPDFIPVWPAIVLAVITTVVWLFVEVRSSD